MGVTQTGHTTDKVQTLPLALLEAWWPAEQAYRNTRRLCRSLELAENVSLRRNLVCAHGTTILTNHESSELVGECIFYALQVRTRTI